MDDRTGIVGVLSTLTDEGMKFEDIVEESNCSHGTVQRRLEDLTEEGVVERDVAIDEETDNAVKMYSVPDKEVAECAETIAEAINLK